MVTSYPAHVKTPRRPWYTRASRWLIIFTTIAVVAALVAGSGYAIEAYQHHQHKTITTSVATTTPTPHASPITTTISPAAADAMAIKTLLLSPSSRTGLIRALTYRGGPGLTTPAATRAVDNLHIDWNTQAEHAAYWYVKTMKPMTCTQLVTQLSSSGADAFTHDQALHGARHVGVCKD